jgi:hypothetical protein
MYGGLAEVVLGTPVSRRLAADLLTVTGEADGAVCSARRLHDV